MILLVGGMGFIGLNTALRFLEVGQTVVITQHTSHRVPDVLKGEIGTRVLTTRMDVSNPYEVCEVVRSHQVESIVNLMAPPARSVSTHADYHLYTAGLQNVLEAARTFGLRRVSLGSSVAVYGGLPAGPYREDTPLPVHSPTQVSAFKKGMEMHAHYYAAQAKLDVVALRIGSIYGPLYYSMHNPIGRMCHAAVKNVERTMFAVSGPVVRLPGRWCRGRRSWRTGSRASRRRWAGPRWCARRHPRPGSPPVPARRSCEQRPRVMVGRISGHHHDCRGQRRWERHRTRRDGRTREVLVHLAIEIDAVAEQVEQCGIEPQRFAMIELVFH